MKVACSMVDLGPDMGTSASTPTPMRRRASTLPETLPRRLSRTTICQSFSEGTTEQVLQSVAENSKFNRIDYLNLNNQNDQNDQLLLTLPVSENEQIQRRSRRSVKFSEDLTIDYFPDSLELTSSRKGAWGIAPFNDEYWDGLKQKFREKPLTKEQLAQVNKRSRIIRAASIFEQMLKMIDNLFNKCVNKTKALGYTLKFKLENQFLDLFFKSDTFSGDNMEDASSKHCEEEDFVSIPGETEGHRQILEDVDIESPRSTLDETNENDCFVDTAGERNDLPFKMTNQQPLTGQSAQAQVIYLPVSFLMKPEKVIKLHQDNSRFLNVNMSPFDINLANAVTDKLDGLKKILQ